MTKTKHRILKETSYCKIISLTLSLFIILHTLRIDLYFNIEKKMGQLATIFIKKDTFQESKFRSINVIFSFAFYTKTN